jgi:integrase
MASKKLSDTYITSNQRVPAKGKRTLVMDTLHPRLGLRVTDQGHRSFVYVGRFGGSSNPTRRLIGTYPATTLNTAREVARQWDTLLAGGIDPAIEKKRMAEEEKRKAREETLASANTFEARAQQYLRQHCKEHRRARETGRLIERELMPSWRDRRVDQITSREIKELISKIAERSPSTARNTLMVLKSFFSWAVDLDHIETSPAASIKPTRLCGEKKPRQRILSDDEIVKFWEATDALGYPYRDLYRLLLLTGVRLREAAHAKWAEIEGTLWTIPPERFKSDTHHLVPLSGMAMQIINELPRCGEHLFTINGKRPIDNFSKNKVRLDKLMGVSGWVVHDLRRVVRSKLASLGVTDTVAELVLGHGKSDVLQRTYNLYQYQPEMRDALERWAGKLRDMVTPPPPNVTQFPREKRA